MRCPKSSASRKNQGLPGIEVYASCLRRQRAQFEETKSVARVWPETTLPIRRGLNGTRSAGSADFEKIRFSGVNSIQSVAVSQLVCELQVFELPTFEGPPESTLRTSWPHSSISVDPIW